MRKKILQKCECGLKMKSTSIARHEKQSCSLRLVQPEPVKVTANTDINAAIVEVSTMCNTQSDMAANELESVSTFSIQTEVKTYKNGTTVLLQDELKI